MPVLPVEVTDTVGFSSFFLQFVGLITSLPPAVAAPLGKKVNPVAGSASTFND